jgi:hypothetical protein
MVVRIALLLLLVVGCATQRETARTGTAEMVDTLAALYQRAMADPMKYPYLNLRRAQVMDSAILRDPRLGTLWNRYLTAHERLRGAQNREAIADIEKIIKAARFSLDDGEIPPDARDLFSLLAMAYLRLGEQENCIDNPAAEVCILPLEGQGRHSKPEGARRAIALFERILKSFPDDLGVRWLLNIAYMAVGEFPAGVPRRYLIPALIPPARPTFPRYRNIAGELGLGTSSHAGGVAIADYNGDGLLDLFITRMGIDDQVRLHLADGKGGYVDRTSEAGLDGITGGLNVVHADYDNDGDEDILIPRGAWLGDLGAFPASLLRNRGDGKFDDVSFRSGLVNYQPSQSAAWADFNLDGCLDLFIGNESQRSFPDQRNAISRRSVLYLNRCDGSFREVSRQVGIEVDEFVKGAAWGDVNNDGLPDLFLSVMGGPDLLYVNQGGASLENWRFEEGARKAGVDGSIFSFTSWFFDYDNDGWEDLLVLSYDLRHVNEVHEAAAREYLGLPLQIRHGDSTVPVERTRLFRNNRDGSFTDVTQSVGLFQTALWGMGANFGDLDNDGWLDFYVGTGTPDLKAVIPNRMFHNQGGRRFEDVTIEGGFGHIQKGHAVAFADLTRSGQEDVFEVMGGAYEGDRFANLLFENPGWTGRRWITLELEGRQANRSAFGARVAVETRQPDGTARTFHRTVSTGGSFGAGPLQLHVGLDRATRVERVTIRWPDRDRSSTSYSDLAMDRFYRIVQGEAPVPLDRPPVPYRKVPPAAGPMKHNP